MKLYFYKKIIVLLGILFLGACQNSLSNDARHAETYEVKHPITITQKQNSIEMPIHHDGSSFTALEEAKVKSFLYQFHSKGNSELIITAPATGTKVGSARQAVKELVEIANKIGISKDYIRIGTYRPLNNTVGGIRMNFEYLTANAKDCSNNWSNNLADAYNNDLSDMHGCSTRKNLAAMIARPEDLIRARTMTPGNAARRVDVIDKYILGQSTTASRNANETASATAQ